MIAFGSAGVSLGGGFMSAPGKIGRMARAIDAVGDPFQWAGQLSTIGKSHRTLGHMQAAVGGVPPGGLNHAAAGLAGLSKIDVVSGARRATANKPWKALIIGKAHASGPHQIRTYREAIRMAKSGEYKHIFVNRSLRTSTDGVMSSGKRPDIIGIRKANGKIDMIEIVSPSQTPEEMNAKVVSVKLRTFDQAISKGMVGWPGRSEGEL